MQDGARIDQSQALDMSLNELVGAIFVRSQVIEQLMRQMLEISESYSVPANFDKKTFGSLLVDFTKHYPDIKVPKHPGFPDMTLYSDLIDARDIRNDAAHGYHLANMSIAELLHDYGGKAEDINRYIHKGIRKSLWAIDYCMISMIEYCQNNGWPGDGINIKTLS